MCCWIMVWMHGFGGVSQDAFCLRRLESKQHMLGKPMNRVTYAIYTSFVSCFLCSSACYVCRAKVRRMTSLDLPYVHMQLLDRRFKLIGSCGCEDFHSNATLSDSSAFHITANGGGFRGLISQILDAVSTTSVLIVGYQTTTPQRLTRKLQLY